MCNFYLYSSFFTEHSCRSLETCLMQSLTWSVLGSSRKWVTFLLETNTDPLFIVGPNTMTLNLTVRKLHVEQYCWCWNCVWFYIESWIRKKIIFLVYAFLKGPFNEAAYKNKQMLVSGPKKKSALQAGYFDTQFKRIFENEAMTDIIKIRRQYQIQQSKKNLTKAFVPSSGGKKS